MLRWCSAPRGVFRGTNFMTPTVLGYYKLRANFGYAELSSGTGIGREPIFGVTVRDYRGEHVRDGEADRSQLFHSKSAAIAYIESLS